MKNKKIKCDIYTRVSTTMQVDGYSLDAQKEKLKRYAEFQNMEIVNEYSDEGKSGKSVEGRPEFQRMLDNIENGTDEVQFVLVFKLSRFGRNAADVLNSLQRMQDFGVNLICVEDGIDSSKDSGKLMISVLSAVAEIERENILVQTMEGRKQKAREGKWNGGFAPYGYELVNGELQIAEDEAEIIRLIYDKFIHTNMGISAIAAWLNQHGYKKKKRQNNTLDAFASSFIKGVLDNPVYCGKLAYGRRKNEKVSGTRNEYRIVKQENYMLHDGIHEGIISETDWELAHQKREKTGVKYEKTHSLDHEHILSGILRCPLCGSGMYGNVNRKKKKDGTLYKDYFYYACKHRRLVDGHKCGYRKQWSEEKINNAVEEVIRKLVKNPKFEEAILNKIGSRIDTEEIEKEIDGLEKQHRQLTGAKARLGQQMDSLDIMDKFYEKKYQDMETRLYRLYDEIEGVENSIEEVKNRLLNIQQQKISEENVYQFLLYFDKLYDKFTDLEKKEFLNSFVEQVDIYEQEQPDGRFLKHIKFRFPVYFGDRETQELCWDNESTVDSVLNRGTKITVTIFLRLKEREIDQIKELADLPVLVVDDDELCCESTVQTLGEIGIAGEWVTSGEEAVARAYARHERNDDYFAIIMDWKMPKMDGIEATRRIRERIGRDVTIIVLTSYDYSEIEDEARAAGVDAFIAKPLFRSRLTATLVRIVNEKTDGSARDYLKNIRRSDYSDRRVLLVEDNDLNSEIASEIIGMTGASVEIVENGREAVERIENASENWYDIVFMDVQMPVMNGYEATAAIRALPGRRGQIPIIAMTANAFAEDVQLAKNTGMDEHIAKPLDFEKLNTVMEKYLN